MFELIPIERRINRAMSYDPFRELEEMQRSFFGAPERAFSFRTDVTDAGDAYKLEAELPGFKKEDISVDIEDECLTISAERKLDNNENKPNFVKRERFYGSYSRSFDLSGINADAIDAEYSDGVLTLTLPKLVETAPAARRLEIR